MPIPDCTFSGRILSNASFCSSVDPPKLGLRERVISVQIAGVFAIRYPNSDPFISQCLACTNVLTVAHNYTKSHLYFSVRLLALTSKYRAPFASAIGFPCTSPLLPTTMSFISSPWGLISSFFQWSMRSKGAQAWECLW